MRFIWVRMLLVTLGLVLAMTAPVAARAEYTSLVPNSSQVKQTLIVSPEGPFTSLQDALREASDGDRIQVRGGAYPGPLVIDKSVELEGIDWPAIDGGGQGTVVTIAAEKVHFHGFEVRASGGEPDRDHSGIAITAPDAVVEHNRIQDVLFGIYVAQADRVVIRDNDISSKMEYDTGRKGDSIRLWYSQQAMITGNRISHARDVVLWYSKNTLVRDNLIEKGRYGIHLMYCDGARLDSNRLYDNSVGIFTMYSRDVQITRNDVRRQRGPSGYAVGFKDADTILVQDNQLVDNYAGIFLDGTPFTPGKTALFTKNVVAFNDIGILLLTAVHGGEFHENTLWENVQQVAIQGGGAAGKNSWQANFWSDYTGFDANGDGVGETAYQSDRLFENLTDREPLLRALLYTPAAQTIEFAATSFPVIKPQPKLSDPFPSMLPIAVTIPDQPTGASRDMLVIGLSLFLPVLGLLVFLVYADRRSWRAIQPASQPRSEVI